MPFLRPSLFSLAVALPASLVLAPSTAHAQQVPVAQAPTPPAPTPETRVWVHLDGPGSAILQRQEDNGSWETVCSGSCDRQVPLAGLYRIDGKNVRTSDAFELQGAPGDHIALKVRAADATVHDLGMLGIALGALGVIGASTELALGDQENRLGGPIAGLTVSGTLIVFGAIFVLANSGTTVSPLQPSKGEHAVAGTPGRPSPTWRGASLEERAMPPSVGATLWSLRF
jgi:hypothetical protein